MVCPKHVWVRLTDTKIYPAKILDLSLPCSLYVPLNIVPVETRTIMVYVIVRTGIDSRSNLQKVF